MMRITNSKDRQSGGFSLIELLIVVTVMGILTAIAVPQMLVQRRLTRSTAVTREVLTQMRYSRQLAMSQYRAVAPAACLPPAFCAPPVHVAYTFQYNDATKQITIIGPIPSGTAALVDPLYPNNTGSTVVLTDALTQGGLQRAEISYGIPTAGQLPAGAPIIPAVLDDGVSQTALNGANIINITFQPDGSVIDTTGVPLDRAMFIFNNKTVQMAQMTASAISVIGASGRVRVWRYSPGANKYVE